MGIRDVVLGLLLLACVPAAVWRPFFGLLVFSWLAYMRAPDMAWTIERYRPSLWIAVATVTGVLLHRDERMLVLEKRTVLLGLFFAAIGVSALLAPDPVASLRRGEVAELGKIVFIALLTTGLVRTPDRARLLMLTIAGSLGVLALKSFAQGVASPGTPMHGPGGQLADHNDYGLALVMALPLCAFLARDEEWLPMRAVLAAMSVACVAGVLLTRSRGGLVALSVLALAWLVSERRNPWALIVAPLALALVVFVTPPQLFERVRGLSAGAGDVSAQTRVVAWEKALAMGAANPAVGVGPGNFTENWHAYPPQTAQAPVKAHNTFLQVFAESGAVAALLYVATLVVTIASLARARRNALEPWRRRYAHGVMLSLVAFAAGALFLSRTHFDLVYHLVGLSVAVGLAGTGAEFDRFGLRRGAEREAGAAAAAAVGRA